MSGAVKTRDRAGAPISFEMENGQNW